MLWSDLYQSYAAACVAGVSGLIALVIGLAVIKALTKGN